MAKYQEAAPKILAALEQGLSNKDAATAAGVNEDTFYTWMKEKNEFPELVQRAKEAGRQNAVRDVEAALLNLAKGCEWEDVRTEYESKLNPSTGKYEPVIKKQVRVKKRVPANTEAIKFYLTNKAPEVWKNRLEQNNTGNLNTKLQLEVVSGNPDDAEFPSSEAEVDIER
jgi:hypothetical protein